MYSFAHQNNIQTPSNDPSNPQVSQVFKQRITSVRNQQMSDSSNEIQTPNFHFFHNNLGNQGTFDAYHNQFSHKSSQINKLISTFEDLGLDVEYIEDSDAQNELHSIAETLNQQDELKRTCSLQEKSSDKPFPETTVSILRKGDPQAKIQQKMKLMKECCLFLRGELSFIVSYQEKLRAQSRNFLVNVGRAFERKLSDFMSSQRALLHRESLNNASSIYLQNFRRGNDQLQSLFASKQQKIRRLIKQNEFLTTENQKLQFQLSKIAKKHQKCKQINGQYESMLKMQHQNEMKMNELQFENNELYERTDCLQWNLKQAQRNLAYTNHESKNLKYELERKYQKIFEQTVQKLTKRIEAQTYYKMKHQYSFTIDKTQPKYTGLKSSDELQLPSFKQGSMNRSKSSYETTMDANFRNNKNFVTFRPTVMAESLPPKMLYSPQINNTSSFQGYDSCSFDSSRYSGKSIESHERQAERILNDIKMMKKNKIQTSLSSSMKLDYRRQSFGRLKHPHI